MFSGPDGEYQVDVSGSLIVNSSPVTLDFACKGLGVTYSFHSQCKDTLESGELIELLAEHQISIPNINIYFPQEYRLMVPLRLMIQHLRGDH